MNRKFTSLIVIISIILMLQSCCTIIGYNLGKNLDEKSVPAMHESVISEKQTGESVLVMTEMLAQEESNYKTLFAVVGVAADVSLAFITLLYLNPIKIKMKRWN